jgi:septum formation topological specificity factor MinE
MEINIEDILNDLRRDICRVYAKTKNIEMDLQAKQTIDILTVTIFVFLIIFLGNWGRTWR